MTPEAAISAPVGQSGAKLRQFRTGPDQTTDHGPKIYGENNNDFDYEHNDTKVGLLYTNTNIDISC